MLFTLPIPRFSAKEKLHLDLSAAGLEAEKAAAKVDIPPEMYFLTARNRVREALNESGISEKIDELVEKLLGD